VHVFFSSACPIVYAKPSKDALLTYRPKCVLLSVKGSLVWLSWRRRHVGTWASITPNPARTLRPSLSGQEFARAHRSHQAFRISRSHHSLSMSQSPAPGSSSKPPTATASSSNFNIIFEKALKEYKTKTRQRLTAHPLATEFDKCDSSPTAILAILQDQVDKFNQSRSKDERLQRWLSPTINVLLAFTETLGEGISLVGIN
jgi:hypothetical protein